MGDAVAVAAAEEAHFVGPVGDVGEEVGNLDAALAAGFEFARGGEEFVFGDGAAGFEVAEGFGNGLAGEFDEVRLGIEEIDVAGAAGHEKENDAFGFGGEVSGFRREWICFGGE
jgi:hypothetical protein